MWHLVNWLSLSLSFFFTFSWLNFTISTCSGLAFTFSTFSGLTFTFTFPTFSGLTGNNCTYCGGSIEDNYPPAGLIQTIWISKEKTSSGWWIWKYLDIQAKTIVDEKLENIRLSCSHCCGGPPLPLWHHWLLYA